MKKLLRSNTEVDKPVISRTGADNIKVIGSKVKKRVFISRDMLAAFCRRNHISRLSLFGSVLRDDFRQDSDIDVLVQFDPGHTPGFFKLADIESELSLLFGRKVDLRTPQDLSHYFRDKVLKEAEVQYSAA